MFWSIFARDRAILEVEELKKEAKEASGEITSLKVEKRKLIEEVETLKLTKRLEAEEIKHNTRLVEEATKSELEREKIRIQEQYAKDIAKFRDEQRIQLVESLKEFHSKIEQRFDNELRNLKDIYNMLTEKLPNVNFAFTKDLDGRPARKVKALESK